MKKMINSILGISFLCFLAFFIWINYQMKNNVGDIKFDGRIDNPSFKVCNEDRIFQYYSTGTSYIGERKTIREEITNNLRDIKILLDGKSGYLTFRFIVNCNGEAGRYRILAINENYSRINFNSSESVKLKNSVMKLTSWKAGTLQNGTPVDSYYQITLKICHGKIKDLF